MLKYPLPCEFKKIGGFYMKKLLSLALAAAMCLSLAACGNGGATPPSSQSTPSNSSDIGVIGGGDASTEIVTTDSDLEYV